MAARLEINYVGFTVTSYKPASSNSVEEVAGTGQYDIVLVEGAQVIKSFRLSVDIRHGSLRAAIKASADEVIRQLGDLQRTLNPLFDLA